MGQSTTAVSQPRQRLQLRQQKSSHHDAADDASRLGGGMGSVACMLGDTLAKSTLPTDICY